MLCGSTGCPPPAPQTPRDEKDHGVAACPALTVAVGLAARSPCPGAGHCSFLPVPSRAARGLPFSVAGAVRVGKAGPGIKNKNPPGDGCVGCVCSQGWSGCEGSVPCTASARRGEAIWALAETGRGLLNKELGFFFIFNTRESRPAASAEPFGAGANTICLLQGWLPPRRLALPGERDPKPGGWGAGVGPLP